MVKKYLSQSTRTKHTYEFYKERRDNPQWQDDFLKVRSMRRRNLIIQTIVGIVVISVGGLFFVKDGLLRTSGRKQNSISQESKTIEPSVKAESSSHLSSDDSSDYQDRTTEINSNHITNSSQSKENSDNYQSSSSSESSSISDEWESVYPDHYQQITPPSTDYMEYIVTTLEGIDWLRDNRYELINLNEFDQHVNNRQGNLDNIVVSDSGAGLPLINDAYGHARYVYLWVDENQKNVLGKVKENGQYLFLEGNNEFFDKYK